MLNLQTTSSCIRILIFPIHVTESQSIRCRQLLGCRRKHHFFGSIISDNDWLHSERPAITCPYNSISWKCLLLYLPSHISDCVWPMIRHQTSMHSDTMANRECKHDILPLEKEFACLAGNHLLCIFSFLIRFSNIAITALESVACLTATSSPPLIDYAQSFNILSICVRNWVAIWAKCCGEHLCLSCCDNKKDYWLDEGKIESPAVAEDVIRSSDAGDELEDKKTRKWGEMRYVFVNWMNGWAKESHLAVLHKPHFSAAFKVILALLVNAVEICVILHDKILKSLIFY